MPHVEKRYSDLVYKHQSSANQHATSPSPARGRDQTLEYSLVSSSSLATIFAASFCCMWSELQMQLLPKTHSLRHLLPHTCSSLLTGDVPRVILPTCRCSLSTVSSVHFPVPLLISHCLQHLSVFDLLYLTQEHLSSDSFAFRFLLVTDCLSVRLAPHPWPPLPIPGSPSIAGDVIWRAVRDCSLITG